MSEAQQWQSVVNVIVPQPTGPQVLACQEDKQWHLPSLPPTATWTVAVDVINAAMQQRFGLTTTVLRLVAEQRDEEARLGRFIYLLENHQPEWLPPTGFGWVGLVELDELMDPAQRAAVVGYLHERTAGVTPTLRAAWARPGWYQTTAVGLLAQARQLGYVPTGPVAQVKNWFLSCILRVPTAQGDLYFKATNESALMANEASMTQALAQLFPRWIPKPLWLDPPRHAMLLADFGNEVGWEAPLATRCAVLREFARLQSVSASQLASLFAAGCIDRRLSTLAEQIDPLFSDPAMLAYVDAEKQQQLQAAAPRLKVLCARLAQYAVPATLVHGDMHMSNVARQGEQSLFFDWSDACVAHPFLDMIDILHERDAAVQTQLRDSYLAMWTDYEPNERLLEMWQIAYPLCALHQAVSYRAIIANLEDACKPEMAWAMPTWFGKLLTSLEQVKVA